jgi:hypothetical protein
MSGYDQKRRVWRTLVLQLRVELQVGAERRPLSHERTAMGRPYEPLEPHRLPRKVVKEMMTRPPLEGRLKEAVRARELELARRILRRES